MRGRDPLPQAGHLPKNCFEFPCPNKILQENVNPGPWRIMMQNKTNNISCFSCNHLCFTSPCFHQEIGIAAQLAALHRCPFRTLCTLAKAAGLGCSSYPHTTAKAKVKKWYTACIIYPSEKACDSQQVEHDVEYVLALKPHTADFSPKESVWCSSQKYQPLPFQTLEEMIIW